MRGLAILAVMLLHFCERGRLSGDELVHRWVWPVLSHGYLGVQLFFVISGYCIAAAVYGMRGKDKPLRQFMIRRVRRIFPPYWWSIVLVVMLAVGTMLFAGRAWLDVFPLTTGDWVANALLLQGPLHSPDLNLVYWSLSIEIQFYVLMSFCLLSFRWASFIWFSCQCSRAGALDGIRGVRVGARLLAGVRLRDRGVLLDHGRASLSRHTVADRRVSRRNRRRRLGPD